MSRIDVWNASIDFPIFDAKSRSLKKAMLGTVGGSIGVEQRVPVIEALHGITLSLCHGDRVGLVGHNGAGKSTLLRLLAGIYEPTRGAANSRGHIAPVFDLGIGMDPEISGRENIIIRGLFLGMTRRQMLDRIDDIADFTELGDYIAMPLRTYSTGMRVRLALGVVSSITPEILLLDEGISAIDADFVDRAQSRLQKLINRSHILVFASHTEDLLKKFCTSALWLESGQVRARGAVPEILDAYHHNDVNKVSESGYRDNPFTDGK